MLLVIMTDSVNYEAVHDMKYKMLQQSSNVCLATINIQGWIYDLLGEGG